MENLTLHMIKSNPSPIYKLPQDELRSRACTHPATDYTRYNRYQHQNLSIDSESLKMHILATRMKLLV